VTASPPPAGIRCDPGPLRLGSLASGAVGGLIAAVAALLALVALSGASGRSLVRPLNVVGAALVRWLQRSAPQALDKVYLDATIGGLILAMVAGAVAGALLAMALDRLPEDQPLSWGLLTGLVAAALLNGSPRSGWGLGPSLNPLLVTEWGWRGLLVAGGIFGAVLGVWLHLDRRASRTIAGGHQP
jgi:hypothetical protein